MEIKTDPVSLENLFTGHGTRYSVPDYQRDYAWTADQVEELWMDINTSRENASEYFMGAVVLNRGDDSEDEYEIVDGQQRLSTFSLLFSVIAALGDQFAKNDHVFPKTPRTEANIKTAQKIYAMAKDRLFYTSEPDHYYLTINKKDRKLFDELVRKLDEVLINDEDLKVKSNESRIKKTRKIFFKLIKDQFGESKSAVDDLYKTLVHFIKKLKFIRIIVQSDTDAFLLFESLNSKGMDLSIADLVKNKLLMMNAGDEDKRQKTLDSWDQMMANIEGSSRTSPVDYLRNHWISFNGSNVTKKELYKEIKKHVSSNDVDVVEFASDLEDKSEFYSEMTSKDLIWPDGEHKKDPFFKVMSEINTLKYTLCHPVILYAQYKRKELVERIAKLSLSFLFRWVTVGDYSVGSAHDIFQRVLSRLKANKSQEEVIEPLLSESGRIGDDIFRESFKTYRTWDNQSAKYILGKIHVYDHGTDLIPNFSELHLEHIFPQQKSKWIEEGSFKLPAGSAYDDWIYHIGNLTLLNSAINQSVKNDVFKTKVNEYQSSPFLMTNTIYSQYKSGREQWSHEWILERAEEWAEKAPLIWPLE